MNPEDMHAFYLIKKIHPELLCPSIAPPPAGDRFLAFGAIAWAFIA
jgi:hypothetical protein